MTTDTETTTTVATSMDVDPVIDSASPSPAALDTTTTKDHNGGACSGNGDDATSASHRRSRLKPVSPRSLEEMTSGFELVYTILGSIKAHRRLYEDAGYVHGDINPNTIIILDWSAADGKDAARDGAGGGDAKDKGKGKNEDKGARTEGALVDFDIPYTREAIRKLGEDWPPKNENPFQAWKRRAGGRGYWFGYGNGYVLRPED
ncbi:hypothetical protein C8Q80DRAFT_1266873 [Daedaleopsis nitida]|nr:hypothetical protein C8Q80DRAFT_1266873 [Daedaleopsis nitida]